MKLRIGTTGMLSARNAGMRVFAWIATFGLMLLIARITSLQDFGRYGTAIAWSLVLAALAPVGLEFVCLRHIPIEIAAAKLGHAKALLVKAKVTTLLCCALRALSQT
jgi:hypothetical protein